MRKIVLVCMGLLLGTASQAMAGKSGTALNGFQCVALNSRALGLTPQDLWSGEGLPWVLETPVPNAPRVSRVSGIIYVTWPIKTANGFVQVLRHNGELGWLQSNAIRPLRRRDGSIGGCTLFQRGDGQVMFHLDPGVGVKN